MRGAQMPKWERDLYRAVALNRLRFAVAMMNPRYKGDFEDVLAHPERYTLRALESWATWAEGPRVQEPDLPDDELRTQAEQDHRDMEGPSQP